MIVFSGKEHISFCLLCLIAMYYRATNLDANDYIFIFASIAGCLAPDVDHKNAVAGYVFPLHYLFSILNKKLKPRHGLFKHGGITHTAVINIIIAILPALLGQCADDNATYLLFASKGFAFGYFTHLLADDFSGNRLKNLWWPMKIDLPLLVVTPIFIIMYRLFFLISDKTISWLK